MLCVCCAQVCEGVSVCLGRHLRREETAKEDATRGVAALSSGPKLDLGFKEGQTITISMPVGIVVSDYQLSESQ